MGGVVGSSPRGQWLDSRRTTTVTGHLQDDGDDGGFMGSGVESSGEQSRRASVYSSVDAKS
ncbi:hypothetical protein ACP70R_031488 [Stipagrostis hirtigluma subsp. patula]